MKFSSVKTKKLLYLFKTSRRRRGLEGEEHGLKTEPAILSVEVPHAAFFYYLYMFVRVAILETTQKHVTERNETKLTRNLQENSCSCRFCV